MLVDTNVIIEAHRIGAWAALVGAYGVETVEDSVAETQTGYQRRAREQWIEVSDLRKSLGQVNWATSSPIWQMEEGTPNQVYSYATRHDHSDIP